MLCVNAMLLNHLCLITSYQVFYELASFMSLQIAYYMPYDVTHALAIKPIFTRDSICAIARICYGNSVCLSVRHTGGSVKNG